MSELPPLDPNLPQDLLLTPLRLAIDGTAGAGAFLIDPDKAEHFVSEVYACADMLDEATRAAQQAGHIKSSGGDPVTDNAVVQANRMATNAEHAMRVYQQQLRDTATALKDQLAAYRAADAANTAGSG